MIETRFDDRIQKLQGKINRRKRLDKPVGAKLKYQFANQKSKQFAVHQKKAVAPQYDTAYYTQVGAADHNLRSTQADLAGREIATKQQYGFEDTSNPFAVARQLEKNYQSQKRGTLGSYARQGQLYAGSLSNARNIDSYNFEKGLDTSSREYQAALAGLKTQGNAAVSAHAETVGKAEGEALDRALASPLSPATSNPFTKQRNALAKKLGLKPGQGTGKLKDKKKKRKPKEAGADIPR